MKFLHLSDLHLGKQMNDVSLLADQEAVLLGQVVPIARRENVDAVLIAGDVYQRATPQAEAVALFDRFVSELAAMGRRVFIISGNHDSAQRISYFSALVRSAGVYVTEVFEGRMQSVTLSDEYGELTVWMLPFLQPPAGQAIPAGGEDRHLSGRDAGRSSPNAHRRKEAEYPAVPSVHHGRGEIRFRGAYRRRAGSDRRGGVRRL